MTEFDLDRSRAVLIGTWSYTAEELPDVQAARNSLELMRATLESEICGWPASSLTVVRNPADPADLPDRLMRTFAEASEVALFYFVGHGQVDEEDGLCLCTANSVTAAPRRGTTSLGYDSVRRALLRSPARVKIVILDCCYSGIATEHSSSLASATADLVVRARTNGVYTMAASGPYGTAWFEPAGAPGDVPLTYFTKYFAQVVQTGIPDEPTLLRLNPIYLEVHARLVAAGKPAPTRRASDTADEFPFARNVIPAATGRDPGRADLEVLLVTREKELEGSRLERQQLTEQLAGMRALLAATRLKEAVVSDAELAEVEQETGALAEEVHDADSRVRRDEQRVDELSRPDHKRSVWNFPSARRRAALPYIAVIGVSIVFASIALLLNRQIDRGTADPAANTSKSPTATPEGEIRNSNAPSAPFSARSPWRLEVNGSFCSVSVLNSRNEEVGNVYSLDAASGTRWIQVRASGTFRYQIAADSACTARPIAGGGTAPASSTITRSSSDSLVVQNASKVHIVATPAEDQCHVVVHDSANGKVLLEKIGNPGVVLNFDADTGARAVYVSAAVSHCTVTLSAVN